MNEVFTARGVSEEARKEARIAAIQRGMSVGEWLTEAILGWSRRAGQEKELQARGNAALLAASARAVGLTEPQEEARILEDLPDWLAEPVERTLEPVDEGNPPSDEPTVGLLIAEGLPVSAAGIKKYKEKTDPAKIPGVSRGAKEPLWKNKKKKALL